MGNIFIFLNKKLIFVFFFLNKQIFETESPKIMNTQCKIPKTLKITKPIFVCQHYPFSDERPLASGFNSLSLTKFTFKMNLVWSLSSHPVVRVKYDPRWKHFNTGHYNIIKGILKLLFNFLFLKLTEVNLLLKCWSQNSGEKFLKELRRKSSTILKIQQIEIKYNIC